ncbi:RDD family protein [Sporosarcina contaminans]|uniref:RDD family protein n=1 Tax=Sporosarcina contaminans TaxID=633403 RepID=A0ABW3TZC7_9BACL
MNYESTMTSSLDRNIENNAYAGFWIRFGASLIDGIVLAIPLTILAMIFIGVATASGSDALAVILPLLLYIIIFVTAALYYVLLTSGKYQGTVGKMIVGVKVVDPEGNRIGKGRALGRFFSYYLSGMFFSIGYIIAGFTPKKQALHDYIASTYVVKK